MLDLLRVGDDVDLAVSLAGAGLEKVRSRWTWDRVIPQYRSLLKTAPD